MVGARVWLPIATCLSLACACERVGGHGSARATVTPGDPEIVEYTQSLAIVAVEQSWTPRLGADECVVERDGYWRRDAVTQWLESSVSVCDEEHFGVAILDWRAIVAEPRVAVHVGQPEFVVGFDIEATLDVYGAARGSALTQWRACLAERPEADVECSSGGFPTGSCELLDVSPALDLAFTSCEWNQLTLIDTSLHTEVALPFGDANSEWLWGRSAWLALFDRGGELAIVDLTSGEVVDRRSDVVSLAEVPLAADQDRLALTYNDHFEILEANGERVIDIHGDIEAAALSPDGQRVAVLGEGEVHVIDIASRRTITRFTAKDAFRLAFRQDGEVLFLGDRKPAETFDANTGERLGVLAAPILYEIAHDRIDPSWRWIAAPDGGFVRTLDFRRLEFDAAARSRDAGLYEDDSPRSAAPSAFTETGLYDGDPAPVDRRYRFRIGEDPDAEASYTQAQLDPWLRRPGLVEAFFAGEQLDAPRIPIDEVAKLSAER